jgi:hypothetical protein
MQNTTLNHSANAKIKKKIEQNVIKHQRKFPKKKLSYFVVFYFILFFNFDFSPRKTYDTNLSKTPHRVSLQPSFIILKI